MVKNKSLLNGIIIFFIIVYTVVAGLVLYQREVNTNPKLDGDINFLDARDITDLYVGATEPNIELIPYYGSADANINLISYLDIDSDETLMFFEEDFQKIKEEFINTGKIKYYLKHYVTEEDHLKKTSRFFYVKSFLCVARTAPDKYYDYYFDVLNTREEIPYYEIKYNLSITDCMEQESEEMRYNIMEIEKLGIIGKKQMFYLNIGGADNVIMEGLPSYPNFKKIVKQYLFRVGDPL